VRPSSEPGRSPTPGGRRRWAYASTSSAAQDSGERVVEDEPEHAWGGKTYYLQLRMDPLPPERADELLRALLGEDRTLEPLKQILIARTEGNPFFLERSATL
jgi:hypothetical protein